MCCCVSNFLFTFDVYLDHRYSSATHCLNFEPPAVACKLIHRLSYHFDYLYWESKAKEIFFLLLLFFFKPNRIIYEYSLLDRPVVNWKSQNDPCDYSDSVSIINWICIFQTYFKLIIEPNQKMPLGPHYIWYGTNIPALYT